MFLQQSKSINSSQDEELAAQGVQVPRDDILDKTVKLNVEYKVGTDTFVSVHIDKEDVGKNLVEDGLLLVERQRGRKLEKLVKGYEEAMGNAKKNHLNIWRYGVEAAGATTGKFASRCDDQFSLKSA